MKRICEYKSDEDIYKVIRGTTDIRESTKNTHITSLKRITNITGKNLCESILNPEATYKVLTSKIRTKSTLKPTITAILSVLKYSKEKKVNNELFQKWYSIYLPLAKESIETMNSNKPTERQKNNMVTWKDVLTVHSELTKKHYGSDEHLRLSFYVLLKPRRQMDYYRVRIVSSPDVINNNESYIVLNEKPYIVVKHYKTVDAYNAWEKELDVKLVDILKTNLKYLPRDYLFVQNNEKPYENVNSYTKSTNRILKTLFNDKAVTINTLRHAYLTYRHYDVSLSKDEKIMEAHDMGHSLTTQMSYSLHLSENKPDSFKLEKDGKQYVCIEMV